MNRKIKFYRNIKFPLPILLPIGLLIVGMSFLNSCQIMQQSKEYKRFINSQFNINKVEILSIGKIDLTYKKNTDDLSFGDIISLGTQIANGNLPITLKMTIAAYNPAGQKAAVSGSDWLLFSKTDTLARGTLTSPLSIPPQQTIHFQTIIHFNLGKIISSGMLPEILQILSEQNRESIIEKMHLVFKIRPWYHAGEKIYKAPFYITIHPRIH